MITFYKMSPNLWYFAQEGKVMVINNNDIIKESLYVSYPRFLESIEELSLGLRPRVKKCEFESAEDFINFKKLLT